MSVVLPTNRDENWRYANLRPLAKARADAAVADAGARAPIVLPPPLPGYERWVFVDGQFAAELSTPAAQSHATLLNARDAGEEFTAMLDASIASEGAGFRAGAHQRRARQRRCCTSLRPMAPAVEHRTHLRRVRRGRQRALRIRACRCTPDATRRCASSSVT